MKHLFTLIVTVLTTVTAFSQNYYQAGNYTFPSSSTYGNGLATSLAYTTPALTGITASSLTKNGFNSTASSNGFRGDQWPTNLQPGSTTNVDNFTGPIDLNKYIEFTLTAVIGQSFSNPKVLFTLARSATGPRQWAWRSSLDNFASNITINVLGANVTANNGVMTVTDANTTYSGNAFQLTQNNLTTVTFRLYGFNSELSTGTGGLQTTLEFFEGVAWSGSAWSPATPTSAENVRFNGNYTVSAGSSFTADNLRVSSGNTLTLEASSSGYAQLKVNGSIDNQGTVIANQYMTGTGHHSVSSPMSNGFTTTNGTSSALYAYDASTGAYNMSPTLTSAGTGFFAPLETSGFLTSAGTFSATGTPTTSHTHTLSYAQTQVSGGSGSGWNLIGNPYTCGLDWNALTKTNVNNTYYVWDPTSSKYQYFSTSALTGTYLAASSILSGVIAPMQAFWVQASTSSAASIVSTMAAAGTVSTSPTFYKTAPDNLILYVEDLSDPSLSDAMWITHATGYTNDFEGDQDAWKLHNYGAKASIFSYHNGDKLAINAIDLSSSASVPVGVKAPEVGKKYQLVLEQVVNNQDYQVILEDRLFNSFTDITGQGYGFTHSAWQNEDPRFVVHINQSTVGMGESSASTVKAYQQGERLILQGNGQQHGSYAVSALDGRVIAQGLLQAGMASIVAPQVGVYIVNFIGAAPETQRIVIQ
jgi:hypothetical protein